MPNKAAFYLARSAVGSFTQTRSGDDPVLIDARRQMDEETFLIAVNRAIDKAAPITPELRQRVIELLAAAPEAVSDARRRHVLDRRGRRLVGLLPALAHREVRAGRFPAKKVGWHWRMTDRDTADALDICANDFRRPTTDVAMATGLTPRSRKKVASLLPTTASPRCSTVDRPDRRRRQAIQRSTPFTQSAEERHTIP